jgi:hypothetical protein
MRRIMLGSKDDKINTWGQNDMDMDKECKVKIDKNFLVDPVLLKTQKTDE